MNRYFGIALFFLTLTLAPLGYAQNLPDKMTVAGWQQNEVAAQYGGAMTGTPYNAIAERVFQRLLATPTVQRGQQLPYRIMLLNANEVNAMSDAVGNVYVMAGMLSLLGEQEGVWAAVLGHEIGHAMSEHTYKRGVRAYQLALQKQNLAYQAQMGQPGAQWALLLQQLAGPLANMKLTRDEESEADLLGLRMMAEAGYHPDNAALLCQRMANASQDEGKLVTFFKHDHPRWVTREENVWRNWGQFADLFNAHWKSADQSPGGALPPIARFGKGSAKKDGKNKLVQVSIPYAVRNTTNAGIGIVLLYQNQPVNGALPEYRFGNGALGVGGSAKTSNGVEMYEFTAQIPAAALETKERKLQAVAVMVVDGKPIHTSQPFEVTFPKR